VVLYVGCASAGTEAAKLIFDEKLADKGLAEAGGKDVSKLLCISVKGKNTYFEMFGDPLPSGKGTSSLRMLANVAFLFLPLNGVVPNSIS